MSKKKRNSSKINLEESPFIKHEGVNVQTVPVKAFVDQETGIVKGIILNGSYLEIRSETGIQSPCSQQHKLKQREQPQGIVYYVDNRTQEEQIRMDSPIHVETQKLQAYACFLQSFEDRLAKLLRDHQTVVGNFEADLNDQTHRR